MNAKFNRYLSGAVLLAISGAASATTCDIALSQYTSDVLSNFTVGIGSTSYVMANHPECFGASATTSLVQINSTTFQQATAISGALSSRMMGSTPGQQASLSTRSMAAGGQGSLWNAWGSLSGNDTRQSYDAGAIGGTAGSSTKNDNNILTTVLGADYALSSTVAVGVSAAFDDGDGAGSNSLSATGNSMSSKGYSVAPYIGWQINKEFSLDVSAGLGKGKVDMTGGVKTEADRRFMAANLNYSRWMNNIQYSGKLGYLHGEEDYTDSKIAGVTAAGTAAKNKLDQIRLGVQAGYWMNNGMMPYAGLAYTNDAHRSTSQFGAPADPIGKSAWVWTIGVNLFSMKNGVTGGIAYNQEESRSNQKNNTLMANINLRF